MEGSLFMEARFLFLLIYFQNFPILNNSKPHTFYPSAIIYEVVSNSLVLLLC